jgi:hypothetical protein
LTQLAILNPRFLVWFCNFPEVKVLSQTGSILLGQLQKRIGAANTASPAGRLESNIPEITGKNIYQKYVAINSEQDD